MMVKNAFWGERVGGGVGMVMKEQQEGTLW